MDQNIQQVRGTDIAAPVGDNADALAVSATGIWRKLVTLFAFNGTTFDRIRTNAAAVISAATQGFAILASRPGDWSVTHAPAVNTVATATKAAGAAGVRHVCTSISARLLGGVAAPAAIQGTLNLRDGATGAGTIIWSQTVVLAAAAGAKDEVSMSGLNIVGSAATAMTLEFVAAGGANTFESVSLTGYSVA